MEKMNPENPDFKIEKPMTRFMLGFINTARKVVRKEPFTVSNILLKERLGMKVKGYKIAKGID